jgi:hypothetical protein
LEGDYMTKMLWLMGMTLTIVGALTDPVLARDERIMLPIRDALDASEARSRLDRGVRLHFGGGSVGPVAKDLGVWKSNKKTNAFLKDDKTACEWAFLSAVLSLQARARKLGGNAVVNITSNYRNVPASSASEYMCGAGTIMAGVALKGRVIRTGSN